MPCNNNRFSMGNCDDWKPREWKMNGGPLNNSTITSESFGAGSKFIAVVFEWFGIFNDRSLVMPSSRVFTVKYEMIAGQYYFCHGDPMNREFENAVNIKQ